MKPDILSHEKILHVLKELEQNPSITQRDLALKLENQPGQDQLLHQRLCDNGIYVRI